MTFSSFFAVRSFKTVFINFFSKKTPIKEACMKLKKVFCSKIEHEFAKLK